MSHLHQKILSEEIEEQNGKRELHINYSYSFDCKSHGLISLTRHISIRASSYANYYDFYDDISNDCFCIFHLNDNNASPDYIIVIKSNFIASIVQRRKCRCHDENYETRPHMMEYWHVVNTRVSSLLFQNSSNLLRYAQLRQSITLLVDR